QHQNETAKQYLGKIEAGKAVPLKAVYINQELARAAPLLLYIGPKRTELEPGNNSPTAASAWVMIDLLPGVGYREWAGATLEELFRAFEKENDYPIGVIQAEVPDNVAGVPKYKGSVNTKG